ncbi:MAG: response regulator transcription factor [Mycobacteriales bacterium]
MKKVLLVDDHDLIRQGLRHAFERTEDFVVCGDAASIAEGLAVATQTQPDVVIMDMRLPDGSGLDAVKRLRAGNAALGIVVLTMYPGDEYLFGALEAGASAFVSKDGPADEVIAAARHAAEAPESFSAAYLAAAMKRRMAAPVGPQVSPREREVLRCIADGYAVAQIAKTLYISQSTTKTHISNLYEKLGAGNRAQAIMAAMRLGLIKPQLEEALV